jgi:hypothetical protein
MLTFPEDFPLPLMPESDDNSAKHDRKDSTISTTTDANYTKTRPRASRRPQIWTYTWNRVSDANYTTLDTFSQAVGMSDMFLFTPWNGPTKGIQTTVRITAKGDWQEYYAGWKGSITFEEV